MLQRLIARMRETMGEDEGRSTGGVVAASQELGFPVP